MKPHKWAKEIKAWADGAEIEYAVANSLEYNWYPLDNVNRFEHRNTNFRIKPQPKEPQYLYVYEDIGGINITSDKNYATKDMEYIGKIKLEVDDEV
jgi:hypothetical protein